MHSELPCISCGANLRKSFQPSSRSQFALLANLRFLYLTESVFSIVVRSSYLRPASGWLKNYRLKISFLAADYDAELICECLERPGADPDFFIVCIGIFA